GCLRAVKALLHLERHHLHGNDGIVLHQAQRQYQRAQGDLVQTDVELVHQGKGHRQHERDRQGHDQVGAQAQGEETHHQYDDDRLGQYPDDFADTVAYRFRLIRDLVQPHAQGQGLAQPIELGLQGSAQLHDVAPALHRYRQAPGILLHEAHARGHGAVEAGEAVADVLDTEVAVTGPHGEAADLLHAAELTGGPQTYPLIRGLEEAGLAQIVLLLQCLLHCRHRQAQGSQPRVGYLDPDLLVLHADQLDLADVADA